MSKDCSFVALYRGPSVGEARLIALCTDKDVVAEFAERLLGRESPKEKDPVRGVLENARREALRLVKEEARNA